MKKHTTLIVSATVALSLLAGCSAADSTAGSNDIAVAADAAGVTAETNSGAAESETVAAATEENAETQVSTDDYVYDAADVVEISLGTSITAASNAVTVDGTTATIAAAGT